MTASNEQQQTSQWTSSDDQRLLNLALLIQHSPVAMRIIDTEGIIVEWNPANERVNNIPAEEALGTPYCDLLRKHGHEDATIRETGLDFNGYEAALHEVLKTGEMPDFIRSSEMHILNTDRWVQAESFTIPTAEGFLLATTMHDITELKLHRDHLAELVKSQTHELQTIRHRYQAIVDHSSDAVFIIALDRRYVEVNQRAADLLGYTIEELGGKNAYDIIHPDQRTEAAGREARLLAGESIPVYERFFVHKDGHAILVEINLYLVRDETGKPLHIQSIVRDISERKQAEKALQDAVARLEQLDQVRNEFISSISHELRTPVTNIKLNHHLLHEDPTNLSRYLARLDRETERLIKLIEDLLMVAGLNQNRLIVELEGIDLNVHVGNLIEDREPSVADRGLFIDFEPLGEAAQVWADPALLDRAIGILVDNSVNYTPKGGRIQVSIRERDQGGVKWLGVLVRDNGLGISPDELPRVLDPFFRGKASLISGTPGTGLGLSTVQRIMESHGGRVEIQSTGQAGEGATVALWFIIGERSP
jgi:PAS domain S-box-containing protein